MFEKKPVSEQMKAFADKLGFSDYIFVGVRREQQDEQCHVVSVGIGYRLNRLVVEAAKSIKG